MKRHQIRKRSNSNGTPHSAYTAKSTTCFKCGKEGHISKVCRTNANVHEPNVKTNRNDTTTTVKCFLCNKLGHIGKNCPKYGDGTPNARKPKPKATTATANSTSRILVANTTTTNENATTTNENSTIVNVNAANTTVSNYTNFILNSGASRHLTNISTT